jgi:hypothetical protein
MALGGFAPEVLITTVVVLAVGAVVAYVLVRPR